MKEFFPVRVDCTFERLPCQERHTGNHKCYFPFFKKNDIKNIAVHVYPYAFIRSVIVDVHFLWY